MQSDCEIYVDPEEDEVFFGCMSEREKNVCSKLLKCTEPSSKDCKASVLKIDEGNINVARNEQSNEASNEGAIINPTELAMKKNLENSFETNDDSVKILSKDSSVELDHCYSTPMKHKIDKSILTTPKSVVKADRDGGFLEVLSEIALVKAEAEGDKEEEKKEDEDKENKIVQSMPEIKITEATPEKGNVQSPPKSVKTKIRRFSIIYNSPQSEDNIDQKSKSHSEGFESERNLRNKYLDKEVDKGISNESKKSVDLIDFNESNISNEGLLIEGVGTEDLRGEINKDSENKGYDSDDVVVLDEKKPDCEISPGVKSSKSEAKKLTTANEKPPEQVSITEGTQIPLWRGLRFSKEARKVVEVLKKSVVDDTLNFTIPEMDLENEENNFLSPESMPALSDTVILNKSLETPPAKTVTNKKLDAKSTTVEKECSKVTPVISRSRLQPLKYFSDRKLNKLTGNKVSQCVKKLPVEQRKAATVEKVNGGGGGDCNAVPASKIPVIGSKNSKVPVNDRLARPLASKSTPSRIASAKSYKNSNFNHIESPINAYIHSKPTSLVQNIKPEVKKDGLSKVWKVQTTKSTTKLQKTSASAVRLPFVEYKSGTPFKIEKRSESRLPRLAPTIMKLIGTESPKVLKHEGRFYMKTPRKQSSTENSTIVAEPNEVSVVLSHPAQKSCTFK